jgi:starch-binding outer membrane protein, SusD/RagB family
MKKYIIYLVVIIAGFSSCKKVTDLYPESNLTSETYYKNAEEVYAGLVGCYSSLQRPQNIEWQLTELRSDNTKMGIPTSTNTVNRDLSDLDVFIPSTSHPAVYEYWLATYNVIRNANVVLKNLGVKYQANTNSLNLEPISIVISDSLRKQYAGEALFLRGNAYFNLVRLYGGVFLVDEPITSEKAKTINRSSVTDIYNFIKTDLNTATNYLSKLKFAQIASANVGKASHWSAKGILAKVHLTLNEKTTAATLLQDIITNSGYGLHPVYDNIFATNNEMNNEILFSVRYKSGNIGLGSKFGNDFAPLGSNPTVIAGAGLGFNYPTNELDTIMNLTGADPRRSIAFGVFGTGTNRAPYVKKYLTPVTIANDGESDWPVLRYADVVLMFAEAQGFTPASITLINSTRARVGLGSLPATVNTIALFEQELSKERRFEFAFENQRFFDLVRFNSTMTTVNAEQTLKNHVAKEFARHYGLYNPVTALNVLQSYIVPNKLLLPIPQKEIDTNQQLVIAQNPGY